MSTNKYNFLAEGEVIIGTSLRAIASNSERTIHVVIYEVVTTETTISGFTRGSCETGRNRIEMFFTNSVSVSLCSVAIETV